MKIRMLDSDLFEEVALKQQNKKESPEEYDTEELEHLYNICMDDLKEINLLINLLSIKMETSCLSSLLASKKDITEFFRKYDYFFGFFIPSLLRGDLDEILDNLAEDNSVNRQELEDMRVLFYDIIKENI